MLATTIHKSNTTPHHQRWSDNQDLSPVSHTRDEEIAGLLPQSPIVCLAIHQPDVRSLEPRTGINVCCCTRTAPTTGTAHLTNSPGHRTPTGMWAGHRSRGAP